MNDVHWAYTTPVNEQTPAEESPPDDKTLKTRKLLASGGLFGAIAAMSCCIVPLALFGMGISGAWISYLTSLAPYQPIFIAAAIACIGYGSWLTYRARRIRCVGGKTCARALPNRILETGLIASAVLVTAALVFNKVAPSILTP